MTASLNPLIVRELRGGLRSGRRIALLTFCLAVVAVFFLGIYGITASTLAASNGTAALAVGSTFFPLTVGVELFFICIITPAQTAGAIVAERERQTYDVLLVTPLSPWQIVLGKLVSGLAYVLLLLLAALPIESMAFLMGGVGPADLVLALLLELGTLVLFGSVGLWASATFRGSRASTAVAYVITGLLSLGLPVLGLFFAPVAAPLANAHPLLFQEPPPWLVYIGAFLLSTNPWITAGLTEAQLQVGLPLFWFHQAIGKTHLDLPGPWLIFLAEYAIGSLWCLQAAARSVRRRRAGD